jgi:hypothetical protein
MSDADFVGWLVGIPTGERDTALHEQERAPLAALDAIIAHERGAAELLPRAQGVIPQLIGALRLPDPSIPALAERVSRDLPLVAEVMRRARSAHHGRRGDAATLPQAIAVIGQAGLNAAIAHVVLRPVLAAASGGLAARAADHLWEHTECKAQRCAAAAAAAGLDPLDGFLAGLMHGAGWAVVLRVLDRCALPVPPWSDAFARALTQRRDRLYGKLVSAWPVSPAVDALAEEALGPGLAARRSVFARIVLDGDRAATEELVRPSLAAAAGGRARVAAERAV